MTFLRIPPFPGHRAGALIVPGETRDEPEDVIAALRREQVGGAFWAVPGDWRGRIVLAADDRDEGDALMAQAREEGVAQRCVMAPRGANPWAIAHQADEVRAGAGHELALVAALAGARLRTIGRGPWARVERGESALVGAVRRGLTGVGRDPFDGRALSLVEVVALLGAWRRGIEANREFDAVQGVARWKRVTMGPMLWDGGGAVPFGRRGARVLGWRARMGDGPLWGEVEDGFIRSVGLGARCVPPLSVVVDRAPHIDPARESGLERILNAPMGADLIVRAAALRARLVRAGIGKYGAGAMGARTDPRRTILVCGQVEDDRAMLLGGAGVSNLELLKRARAMEPGARIIWRPHPDVEAGLRRGAVDARGLADQVEREAPLAGLLAQVDAVHVICSLAGFEALLRGVPVVTHGAPFYAGWGLTRDLGPVRERRRLALDELVAGVLLMYPRYVDPVTLLPCQAEVVVGRIEDGLAQVRSGWGWMVLVRKIWGWVLKRGRPGVLHPRTPMNVFVGATGSAME